jgi:hypothetical protein
MGVRQKTNVSKTWKSKFQNQPGLAFLPRQKCCPVSSCVFQPAKKLSTKIIQVFIRFHQQSSSKHETKPLK